MMATKAEIPLHDWIISSGKVFGLIRSSGNRLSVVRDIIKQPDNPKVGDKIETTNVVYILKGKRAKQ